MIQIPANTNEPRCFKLRAYSPKQLSELYEVSAKTLKKWLQPILSDIGERQGRYYNITQVRRIIQHLGIPGTFTVE